MPLVPRNPDDIPTQFEVIPDDTQVKCVIREAKLADKLDKRDNGYAIFEYEVMSPPEWEGRKLTDNYVGFPDPESPTMSASQRRRAMEKGIRLSQIIHSFNVPTDGVTPENPIDLSNEVEKDEINGWLQNFVGCEGEMSVSVDVYQGRPNNKIKMYLLP